MKVYEAMRAVSAEIAKDGIGKSKKNTQQGYSFRGIDDVQNGLAPLLAKHGLLILPRFTERTVVERATAKGTALLYATVTGEFDFVSAEDGSKHTIQTFGEAMDSGDKATNKAMSAAYKYAATQALCIPTEGQADADATTHELAAGPVDVVAPETPDFPKGYAEWLADLNAVVEGRIGDVAGDWSEDAPELRAHLNRRPAGLEQLKYAWTESPLRLRSYLTSTNKNGWEGMKAAAAQRGPQAGPKAAA